MEFHISDGRPPFAIKNTLDKGFIGIGVGLLSEQRMENTWVEKQGSYPLLSQVVVDILTIPASSWSAPIERVFSTAGESTTGKRNRLQSSNLEREVILRKNTKYLTTRNILKTLLKLKVKIFFGKLTITMK